MVASSFRRGINWNLGLWVCTRGVDEFQFLAELNTMDNIVWHAKPFKEAEANRCFGGKHCLRFGFEK
jgi:uncharacterized protein (DUF608 family)